MIDQHHTASVSRAFARKSAVYDEFGKNHVNLSRMRQKVYGAVERHIQPSSHLLEINAGTGLDATEMVRRGHSVHATELSGGMMKAIQSKIKQFRMDDRLTAEQLSFTALDQIKNGPFDAVYSNFGGLNCIPDLRSVTRHLTHVLKPGGIAVWVVMPRICPWEIGLFFKDWQVATRRFRPEGVEANVEGVSFTTWYFSANQVIRAFGPRFECLNIEGLSVATPSADNKTFAIKHPTLFKRLVTIDEKISNRWPFNRMGDFIIVTMRLKQNAS